MTPSNGYQLAGRVAKAQKLADLLAAHGYKHFTVAGFGDHEWSLACAAARIKSGKASEETRALVVKMLREREGRR